MKTTTRGLLFLLLASIFVRPQIWAQDSTAPAPGDSSSAEVSQAEIRRLALENSPDYKKALLTVDDASLEKLAQDYERLPSLSAGISGSGDYLSSSSVSDALSGSVKLDASMTVFDGGSGAALSKKYSLATQSARETLRSTKLSVVDDADTAFFAVLEAQASLEAAQSDRDAADLRLEIARVKAEAGALSRSDLLSTESEAASYETALVTARKTLASARAKISSLTKLPMNTQLSQVDFSGYDDVLSKLGTLDETVINRLVSDLRVLAEKNSPSLAVYDLAAGQARMDLASAKSAWLPTLSAEIAQSFAIGSSGTTPSGSVSLSASLSLDFWTTKNSVDRAKIALDEAEIDVDGGMSSLALDLEQAVYEWLASALAIPSSSKALEYAQSNYENVMEQFRLSSATTSDLSTAEALVSTDKNALIAAQYGFLTNLSTLRSLVGLEDENLILELLAGY